MSQPQGFGDKVAFVWKVADKLRGTLKQHEYGQVMLPLLVLRRLDAVLEPTKPQVLAKAAQLEAAGAPQRGADLILQQLSGYPFYNTSPLSFAALVADDKHVAENLEAYIAGFSPAAAEVIRAYDLPPRIRKMKTAGILYPVVSDFVDLDLAPGTVGNEAMGYIFEELLRRFAYHPAASCHPSALEREAGHGSVRSVHSLPSHQRWVASCSASRYHPAGTSSTTSTGTVRSTTRPGEVRLRRQEERIQIAIAAPTRQTMNYRTIAAKASFKYL